VSVPTLLVAKEALQGLSGRVCPDGAACPLPVLRGPSQPNNPHMFLAAGVLPFPM
jgi:hypothetical protein